MSIFRIAQRRPRLLSLLFWPFILASNCCFAQDQTNLSPVNLSDEEIQSRRAGAHFTTPEYQKQALDLMIDEVNRVAVDLNLPEPRPIIMSNVVEAIIDKPVMAYEGFLGGLTTSNYTYTFTLRRKFTGPAPAHFGADFTNSRVKGSRTESSSQFAFFFSQLEG